MERELAAIRHKRLCTFGIKGQHRIDPLRQPLSAKAPHADTKVRQGLRPELNTRRNSIGEQAVSGYAGSPGYDFGRRHDSPIWTNGDGPAPFLQARLPEKYLLPTADERNDHGPSVQPIHHVEEFGSLRTIYPLFAQHLLSIPCALSLIEDDDVLVWQSRGMLAVIAQELVDVLNEGRDFMGTVLTPTPGTLLTQHQRLSHDLDQWAVTRQENSRRATFGAQRWVVDDVESCQCLARTGDARDKAHVAPVLRSCFSDDLCQQVRRSAQVAGVAVADLANVMVLVETFGRLYDRQRGTVRCVDPGIGIDRRAIGIMPRGVGRQQHASQIVGIGKPYWRDA